MINTLHLLTTQTNLFLFILFILIFILWSFIKGVDLPEGKKKKIGDDGRQECGTEYDRSKP